MDVKNLLNPEKQHQVLLSILGWLPGHDTLFIVALKDGNKAKELIVRPDHLKLQN